MAFIGVLIGSKEADGEEFEWRQKVRKDSTSVTSASM